MITFFCPADDPYSSVGINHFIEKFGLDANLSASSQTHGIVISGMSDRANRGIFFQEQQVQETICGRLQVSDHSIPLWQVPAETGSDGVVIGYFVRGDLRYPCITRKKDGMYLGLDIFRETGYILSGHLEVIWDSLAPDEKQELAVEPTVDIVENLLFDLIVGCYRDLDLPLVQKSIWPDGKPFAVCLTHDVDELKKTYQWLSRPLRYLKKRDFTGLFGQGRSFLQKIRGHEPYYTFDDIIDIEKNLEAKSTYYILKETGTARLFSRKTWYLYGRNRSLQTREMHNLIQCLLSNGDEVAIHGSYFSYRDAGLLTRETQELEDLIDEPIVGTRQHNLNLEIPETWEHQVKAGLKYDTSLGFKDRIGFRWGTSFPFYPVSENGFIPLLEIPLIIMDICLDSCKDKERECLDLAAKVFRHQGVLTLLWHPPIFNTLEYPEARDIYIKINQHCRYHNAWIVRGRDIYEWLAKRKAIVFSSTCEGDTCTITSHTGGSDLFFTLLLPNPVECRICSGNARIIKNEGVSVYIKTNNLEKEEKIIVKFQ